MNIELTPESSNLLEAIAKDAANWNGLPPCFNHITLQNRGNLTDLKKKGLLSTFKDEGEEWIQISRAGKDLCISKGWATEGNMSHNL